MDPLDVHKPTIHLQRYAGKATRIRSRCAWRCVRGKICESWVDSCYLALCRSRYRKFSFLLFSLCLKMPNCAVALCKNYNQKTKGTNIKYFRFLTNSDLAKQWIVSCKRNDEGFVTSPTWFTIWSVAEDGNRIFRYAWKLIIKGETYNSYVSWKNNG